MAGTKRVVRISKRGGEVEHPKLRTSVTKRMMPLSMEFSRQEYWCGLPFPSPGNLADPGIEAGSPALQVDSLLSESPGKTQHFSDIVDIQICAFQMD